MEAFDNNDKHLNDKFKKYCKFYQDTINIILCH